MDTIEIVLVLLAVVALVTAVACRIGVPYPILIGDEALRKVERDLDLEELRRDV